MAAAAISSMLLAVSQAAAQQAEYEVPTPAPTGTATLVYLNPFPVVRLAGRITRGGARITLLRVRSPWGSRVTVRCRGGRRLGCPFRSKSRISPPWRFVRYRELERPLRAGVLVEVFVRSGQTIGKYTSFKIRRRRVPLRDDLCALPGDPRPRECP